MIKEPNCKLWSDCKYPGACGTDIYMIPGYREEDMEFDHTTKFTDAWDSDFNKLYKCYLPYDECNHDPYCVSEKLHGEIVKNSKEDPVALIGLCYGGGVAQVYASQHPDRVKKLALIQSTDMKRSPRFAERIFKIKDADNVRKINWREIQDIIQSDTFIYNCMSDRLIFGDPPKVTGAKVREDMYCVHGQVPPSVGSRTIRFINH